MKVFSRAIALLALSLSPTVEANETLAPKKATIAIVGDADRFTIGQSGFCGKRNEIESPSNVSFQIPSERRTWFYIRSRFQTTDIVETCEGDFSFLPKADQSYIIRLSNPGEQCTLELFHAVPGKAPHQIPSQREKSTSCLMEKPR